jgi:hypothetical protein
MSRTRRNADSSIIAYYKTECPERLGAFLSHGDYDPKCWKLYLKGLRDKKLRWHLKLSLKEARELVDLDLPPGC